MEEAHEILWNSLRNSGISFPSRVTSIRDLLTPAALVSICAQSLQRIDDSLSFPTSLPDPLAERFKICSEIASAIKSLGFRGELSFHQFLYPSEEDSYKLMRFLVERLSVMSEDEKARGEKKTMVLIMRAEDDKYEVFLNDCKEITDTAGIGARLKELKLERETTESDVLSKEASVIGSIEGQDMHDAVADTSESRSSENEPGTKKDVDGGMIDSVDSRRDALENSKSVALETDSSNMKFQQKLVSLREQSSKMRNEIEELKSREEMLKQQMTMKTSEVQQLESKHELLQAALAMGLDDQHPVDFHIEELNRQVESRRQSITELESLRNASFIPLGEKKELLEELVDKQKPNVQEIELKIEAIFSEIKKREEEHSKLLLELQKQPKVASRKSYIQRITEITKNSRKQDLDIERILKDTRELQIQSNSIQERLHRTYAVVDETIFREAKNDPVRRQAYRLLTSIHESFEQISGKILATDRTRREVADLEAKVAAMATRNLNIDKLQADLDAIRNENQLLEEQLQHH